MKILTILITALPDIWQLLKVLQEHADEAETDLKVKDSIKTIHGAFSAKDPTALNAMFNSK